MAQPPAEQAADGKWDKHFRDWIADAEAKGLDPNDVGDKAWANDYLSETLEERYLGLVAADSVVLELGPGSGRLTRHLIKRAKRVELLDNSSFVIDWMNRYLAGKGEFRATLIPVPAAPHLADACIDLVVAHGVFEHLDFDETYYFLAEFARVLKPGGRVSFNYDNIASSGGAEWWRSHRRGAGVRSIFRFYTPDFMARLAELAGLTAEKHCVSDDRLAHLILSKAK
jgi:SAM-dependent methyltransferase